ncbi:unnamed protein product, partial [marine sediment metagenome]
DLGDMVSGKLPHTQKNGQGHYKMDAFGQDISSQGKTDYI